MSITTTFNNIKTYFSQRIANLGLSPKESRQQGLAADDAGNIRTTIRDFMGDPITFYPLSGPKRKKMETLNRRKTIGVEDHRESLLEPFEIIRYTPEFLAQNPGVGKYKFPAKKYTGLDIPVMPTNGAIAAYRGQQKGGTIYGIEGYFKALALDKQGLESIAFAGISLYRLDESLAEYLRSRQPEDLVIMYDADYSDPSQKTRVVSSRRVEDFYNSARRFAAEFFDFCQITQLKTRLHILTVNKNSQYKGIDDLLAASSTEEKANIIGELSTLQPTTHFDALRLHRKHLSTDKASLKAFFGIQGYAQFYEQHKQQIGDQPFQFENGMYQREIAPCHYDLFEADKDHHYFKLLTNPFKVDLPTQQLSVSLYLSEAKGELQRSIDSHKMLAINAPTGSGKTTFFIDYAKKNKVATVICVPTRSLARQLARKHKIAALYGTKTRHQIAETLQAAVIVCTYDMIGHISDLRHRLLLIDESHNLVNQYGIKKPFRKETLRKVVQASKQAKQTILISGTQNKLLCKQLGCHYIDIKSAQAQAIHVRHVEASKGKRISILLEQLQQLDFSTDKIHFVYHNNREELLFIRNYLTEQKVLSPDQIDIITRKEANNRESVAYQEIMQHEQINSPIKLVLSTCLIAEGININNTNIGNIYIVHINCIDSFRQYVARFRKMDSIQVYSLRPPERALPKAFFQDTENQADFLLKQAQISQTHILQDEQQYLARDWQEAELPFYDQLAPTYSYASQFFQYLYQSGQEICIDHLRIIAEERERQIDTMTNAYFYTQLGQFDGFYIEGTPKPQPPKKKTTETLKTMKKAEKEQRQAAKKKIQIDLIERPQLLLSALYLYAKSNRNLPLLAFLEKTVLQYLDTETKEVQLYLEQHRDIFMNKWHIHLVRAYCKLSLLGLDKAVINELMAKYEKTKFNKTFRAVKANIQLAVYEKRQTRQQLSSLHKTDIKALNKIIYRLEKERDRQGGLLLSLTTGSLIVLLQSVFCTLLLTAEYAVKPFLLSHFKERNAAQLLESLYKVDTARYAYHRVFNVGDAFYDKSKAKDGKFLHDIFDYYLETDIGDIDYKPMEYIGLHHPI